MSQAQIRNNRIFGVLLLLTELVLIFMYGFFIAYANPRGILDDYYIISALLILALTGFGLITTYIKPVSIGSLTHIIIIFGLCLQLYFPFRGFWQIIKLSGNTNPKSGDDILPISVSNVYNDRQSSLNNDINNRQMLFSSPLTQFIGCFISLIIAYSGLIGRIGNLQVYIFTVIGTFIYQFNNMIFWRIWITDCGYGMRIFLFGGFFGLISSLILGKKQTTVIHQRFMSDYYYQALNLLGSIIIWCMLPVLNWSDLWHSITISNDSNILHVVSLNIWFALCGSVIGSVCVCILLYKKLSIHTLIFSLFTGGIGYTSISDLYFNPGVAMGIGCIVSIICGLGISLIKISMNQKGVRDSNGVLSSYLIPGLIAGILSAIFQANGAQAYGNYIANTDPDRTRFQQGGIQVAGIFIALGLGIFAGLISGLLMKACNKRIAQEQFDANYIVSGEPYKVVQSAARSE